MKVEKFHKFDKFDKFAKFDTFFTFDTTKNRNTEYVLYRSIVNVLRPLHATILGIVCSNRVDLLLHVDCIGFFGEHVVDKLEGGRARSSFRLLG